MVIIRSAQVGWFFICCLSELLLELLLVAHHDLLAFSLQQADESVDDLQSAAPERNQNQNLEQSDHNPLRVYEGGPA